MIDILPNGYNFYFKDPQKCESDHSEMREWFIALFALEDNTIDWVREWNGSGMGCNRVKKFVFKDGEIIGFHFESRPTYRELCLLSKFTDMSRGAWVEVNPVKRRFEVTHRGDVIDELFWEETPMEVRLNEWLSRRVAPDLGWEWESDHVETISMPEYEFPDRYRFVLRFKNVVIAELFCAEIYHHIDIGLRWVDWDDHT